MNRNKALSAGKALLAAPPGYEGREKSFLLLLVERRHRVASFPCSSAPSASLGMEMGPWGLCPSERLGVAWSGTVPAGWLTGGFDHFAALSGEIGEHPQ